MVEILGTGIAYFAISVPILIVFIVFYFNRKETEKKYDALVEVSKNLEDPAELSALIGSLNGKESREYKRDGVVTLFVGIGLYLFGRVAIGEILQGVGLLVGTIGLGLIVAGFLFPKKEQEN